MMIEKIFEQVNNERIELTGQALDEFLQQRLKIQELEQARFDAETERATKLASAITKLKALGLTETEAKIIIGIE
jgi:hypothetical protein